MKKYLFIIASMLVVLVGCKKQETGDDASGDNTPAGPVISVTTPKIVDIESQSQFYEVQFTAKEAWTASAKSLDGAENAVVLPKTSGQAGDVKLKLAFEGIPEGEPGRVIELTIKAGNAVEVVRFFQGKVFWTESEEVTEVAKAGGKVNVKILTNFVCEVQKYDSFETWAPVTITKGDHQLDIEFDVAAYSGFDDRSAYVKITAEGVDLVVRFYVEQAGSLQLAWTQNFFWGMFPDGTRESISEVGDYIIINCGKTTQSTGGALVFNKSDGTYVKTLEIPSCTGITNDDAGNIIVSTGGNYPLEEGQEYIPLQVFAFTKAQAAAIIANGTLPEGTAPIISYYNGFYGYGLDNLRVTGDVTANAVITLCTSGGYADFYAVDWNIVNGVSTAAENSYSSCTALPNFLPEDYSMGIWTSFAIVAKHTGTSDQSPLYYMGYDNNYNLQYLATPTGEWAEVFVTGGEGNEGYNCMDIIEWNGHKYISFVATAYFAWVDWDGDGTYEHCPGYLYLLNIDDPANPVLESKYEYWCDPENWQYGNCVDVHLSLEGENLVAYVADSATSQYMKVVYPKP